MTQVIIVIMTWRQKEVMPVVVVDRGGGSGVLVGKNTLVIYNSKFAH